MRTTCSKCDAPLDGTHNSYCKSCWNAYQSVYRRRRYRDDAEYRAKALETSRLRLYGVTRAEYDELLERQGGVCAICGAPPNRKKLGVDHDHETGEIRGLLCPGCNRAIGMLKEDPKIMQKAIDYVKRED